MGDTTKVVRSRSIGTPRAVFDGFAGGDTHSACGEGLGRGRFSSWGDVRAQRGERARMRFNICVVEDRRRSSYGRGIVARVSAHRGDPATRPKLLRWRMAIETLLSDIRRSMTREQ